MNKRIAGAPDRIGITKFIFALWLLANTDTIAQNFWQQTNGPNGGKVWAIAINSGGQIFVATDNAIFRSNNNSEKWTRLNSNTGASALAINSSGHIFAGTDNGNGVYRSTNNGDSWTLINNGLANQLIRTLIINSSGHIFVGTYNGVFRSTNNGDSWAPVNTGLLILGIRSFAINSKGHIFAGTDNGIFRSTDSGTSWTAIGLNATIITLAINSNNDDIFAGTLREIYRSADGGDTWTFVSRTMVSSIVISSIGDIFAGDGSLPSRGVLRSTDNGNTWTPIGPYISNGIYAIVFDAKEHILAGDIYGKGLFRSTDNGETWLQVGPPNIDVESLVVNSNGHVFAGSRDWSTDNGDTWRPISIPGSAFVISSSGDFFAASSGIFRSTDNGNTWTHINDSYAYSLAINAKGHIFAGTNEYVLRSIDNGVTWTKYSIGLMYAYIRVLSINNGSGYIFGGLGRPEYGIIRSIDNGETWTQVNTGLTFTDVRAFAINAKGHVFAGTYSGGIFRSTNNGDTWEQTSTGLTSTRVYSLAINAREHIFAGTNGGAFRSIDNGESWMPINSGLTSPDVRSLAISPNGPIFAGTFGGGVFRNLDSEFPDVMHAPQASPQPSGKDFIVDATITDNKSVASAILNYRQSGDDSFKSVVLVPGVDNHYRGSIPASAMTSRGMEYYFLATDSVDNITRFPPSGIFSVQVRVSGEMKRDTLGNPISQPNGSEQSAYRLVSVPLALDNKSPKAVMEDDFGPYNIKKWRFFELGVDQQPHEFPNTTAVTPGKAFWLIVKDAGKVIDTGPGTTNRTDKKYPIPLHPKWNLVGNPFNFPIPVDSIHLKSGELVELRTFTGSWNEPVSNPVKTMQSFEGYAILNNSDSPDTLFINPDLSTSTNLLSKKLTSTHIKQILWSIRILAQCQEARDEDNVAGIVASASNAWDEMDHPEPLTISEYISVSFPHPEWKTLNENYCTDFRPESSEGYSWPFEIKTNIRDKVNLSFEGTEGLPQELGIWLVDEVVPIAQNLRQTRSYSIAASTPEHPKRLQLIVGKSDFVEEKIANMKTLPTTYQLFQNFPNPFNPATTIRYGLPQAEPVTLQIYNLLGEEVVTLLNNELQAAGYHAEIWNGRNKHDETVGSGVYIYRFRAGSFTAIKKMALVK